MHYLTESDSPFYERTDMSDEKNNPVTYKEAYETLRIQLDFVRAELMGFIVGRPECDFNPVIDRIEEVLDETAGKLSVECQLSGK